MVISSVKHEFVLLSCFQFSSIVLVPVMALCLVCSERLVKYMVCFFAGEIGIYVDVFPLFPIPPACIGGTPLFGLLGKIGKIGKIAGYFIYEI